MPSEPPETLPHDALHPVDVLPAPTPLALRPALQAAFVGGVFSALVMNFLGGLLGLGVIGGGIMAVYAYRRRVPAAVLGLASGALLGAVSGLCGFLVFCALAAVEISLSNSGQEMRRIAFESMDKVVLNADPQLQQKLQEVVLRFKTPEGFAFFILFTCLLLCLMFIFFSLLGGAIGANITRRSSK